MKLTLSEGDYILIRGVPHVKFNAILNAAHDNGMIEMRTITEQIPTAENSHLAVVRAEVVFQVGEREVTFSAIGDASPATTQLNCYLRLAETRAMGRALRWAMNIPELAEGELDDVLPDSRGDSHALARGRAEAPRPAAPRPAGQRPAAPAGPAPQAGDERKPRCQVCRAELTQGQVGRSQRAVKGLYCEEHMQVVLAERLKQSPAV